MILLLFDSPQWSSAHGHSPWAKKLMLDLRLLETMTIQWKYSLKVLASATRRIL